MSEAGAGSALAGVLLSALPDFLRAQYAEMPGVLAVIDLHALVEADSKPGVWICDACYSLCHSYSRRGCEKPADAVYPCDTIKRLAAPFADKTALPLPGWKTRHYVPNHPTMLNALMTRAVLAGWVGAREAGLRDVTQSDAVATAAAQGVLDQLDEWEAEDHTPQPEGALAVPTDAETRAIQADTLRPLFDLARGKPTEGDELDEFIAEYRDNPEFMAEYLRAHLTGSEES